MPRCVGTSTSCLGCIFLSGKLGVFRAWSEQLQGPSASEDRLLSLETRMRSLLDEGPLALPSTNQKRVDLLLQQEDQVGRALDHRKEIYQLSGYLYWLRHQPKQDDRIEPLPVLFKL